MAPKKVKAGGLLPRKKELPNLNVGSIGRVVFHVRCLS